MNFRRVLLAWLAFALLAAQSLAFMHRVAHVPQMQVQGATAVSAKGWTAKLFAHHEDDASCRLYDAVGHAGPWSQPLVVLAFALPSFVLAQQQGECLVRFSALFDARAPPLIR